MLLRRSARREGMTLVESTLVLGTFLLLLFGLFEYCRYLMVLHVTNNAARDGARYAVVNLLKPANFNTVDFTDASGNVFPSIDKYTRDKMGGVQKQISGFQLAVYAVDPTGLTLSPPVVRPKSSNPPTYPDPFNSSDPNAVPWNSAVFTERVAVTIKGTYQPLTPLMLFMPASINVNVTAMMGSEG